MAKFIREGNACLFAIDDVHFIRLSYMMLYRGNLHGKASLEISRIYILRKLSLLKGKSRASVRSKRLK